MELNLEKEIFSIKTEDDFNRVSLDVFKYQYNQCKVYKSFIDTLNRKYPTKAEEIPFLPISFFKTHKVVSESINNYDLEFLSSGTTGIIRSKHLIHKASIYEESFINTYRKFIGEPKEQVILALLPSYIDQGNSSLVYMVDYLIRESSSTLSGFLLNDMKTVTENYEKALISGKKVVIFGVSYALLDLADQKTDLSQALIIETGGMKGKRKELSKEELHNELIKGLNVNYISSEYGMTELLSQAYSDKNGLFTSPNWMKILIRDVNDPFSYLKNGKTGGINVIDLANLYSCSFIATQDLGKIEDTSFRIMGRFDNADIRGCNLMVE